MLALGLALTALVSRESLQKSEEAANVTFGREHHEVVTSIRRQLEEYEVMLRATGGASADVQHETPEGWRRFVASLDLEKLFPAAQALEVAPLVKAADRAGYEARLVARGIEGGIRPPAAQAEYLPVDVAEPHLTNEAALGFDLLSEPLRREAVFRARDTGAPALTAPIALVQDGPEKRSPSALYVRPLYAGVATPTTVEARRAAFRGVVLVVFRITDVVAAAVPPGFEGDVHVYDTDGTNTSLVYDTDGNAADNPLRRASNTLQVGGRRWTVTTTSTPITDGRVASPLVAPTTLGGASFSLMIFASLVYFARARGRALDEAHARSQQLDERERFFESVLEHTPDVILTFDSDGRCTYLNRATLDVSGTEAKGWLGRTNLEIEVPEPLRQMWQASISAALEDRREQVLEFDFPSPAGVRWYQSRVVPELSPDGTAVESVLVVSRDLTEVKQAEAERARERQRADGIVSAAMDAIVTIDGSKRIVVFNAAAEQLFGLEAAKVLGEPVGETLGAEPWLTLAAGAATDRRTVVARRPGAVDEALWMEVSVWRSPSGGDQLVTIACRDLTEQRAAQARREKLEEELRQSQKMEAIGRLSGGIAHDFNNLLTVILGNTEMLASEAGLPAAVQEGLVEIKDGGLRAAELTRQLLTFSRRQALHPSELDVDDVIEHVLRMLRRILGEDIQIKRSFSKSPLLVMADRGMIEQVLLNLAVNARDAMPHGGELSFTTSEVLLDAETARAHRSTAAGAPFVRLTVGDTGCGIPPEILSRIFEPFFTTKAIGKGTGLGLATVYGIVEQHGGFIDVVSRVGEGTTFSIWLPRTARLQAPAQPQARRSGAPRGSGTILHVEDEPRVRDLVRKVLEGYGYRVLQSDSGANALALWRERRATIDLVLTDMVMPGGMSGVELGRRIHDESPGVPLLYTSGYAGTSLLDESVVDDMKIIAKPYELESFLRTIHGAMQEARPVAAS